MPQHTDPLVAGNIMLPMDVQRLDENTTALIYATSTADHDSNSGNVEIKLLGQNGTIRLTDLPGDYGPPATTHHDGILWVVHTDYHNKQRSLWLHAVRNGEKLFSGQITAPGKVDNPQLSVLGDHLHMVWEDYTSGESRIQHATVDIASALSNALALLDGAAAVTAVKAYKPQLISDGTHLYLFYEWYGQGRYRLMASCLTPGAMCFTEPHEIGLDTYNDQSVSLALQDGKVVAVWENSRPLHKGYEWISPHANKVIIPNFGHGWRVNTQMVLRRVSYKEGTWHLEDILTAPGATIDTQESAGMPRVHSVGAALYVSYLRWDYGSSTTCKGWQIVTKVFNGERWILLDATDLFQKQRVAPAVLIDAANGVVHSFGQSPELELRVGEEWIQENAATFHTAQSLPVLPSVRRAVYEMVQRKQLVQPLPEPQRTPLTVRFADGERQLLWGDLHMHSNTSPCSLGARFHCTEMEEKFRFCHDVADLDFALNTDHDSMGDNEWVRNGNSAHFFDMPGHFIAFNGFEWTCSHFDDKPNYGHYNIIYKEDGPMLRTLDDSGNSVAKLAAALSPDEALAIPHHPGDHTHPLDWNAFNPLFSPLVEVFQVRGSYEYDNCPMHPELWGRGTVRKHSLQYGLNRGYDFGFTAGGEHEGVGVTGVYAAEFTREGIFNALRERRTFGTTGDRIVVDFRLDDVPMGSRLDTTSQCLKGYLAVTGTDVIESIKIIRNGQVCQEWTPDSLQVTLSWDEPHAPVSSTTTGRDYYYAVISQANGEMAWSSPIFVYSI